jgi:uncharacterized protein YjbI with pentapeptide repeats
MFSEKKCAVPECAIQAVSFEDHCYLHVHDQAAYREKVRQHLDSNTRFLSLVLSGITLSDLNLSGKEFFGCQFMGCDFTDIDFGKSVFKFDFFDFSRLLRCKFNHTMISDSSFACARIDSADFRDSDIKACNFNGITGEGLVFNDSDLYLSTFIESTLNKSDFVDCNLKRANFTRSKMTEVNYQYSNIEEAYFEGET